MRILTVLAMLVIAGCESDYKTIPKWATVGGDMACAAHGGVSAYSAYVYNDNSRITWASLQTSCKNGDLILSRVRGPRVLTQIETIEERPEPDPNAKPATYPGTKEGVDKAAERERQQFDNIAPANSEPRAKP